MNCGAMRITESGRIMVLTPLITETPSISVARSSITVSFTIFTPFEIKVMHTMANTPLITGVGSEVMTAMSFGQNPKHTRMAPPAKATPVPLRCSRSCICGAWVSRWTTRHSHRTHSISGTHLSWTTPLTPT